MTFSLRSFLKYPAAHSIQFPLLKTTYGTEQTQRKSGLIILHLKEKCVS